MSTPVEVPVDDDGEVTPEPVTDDGRGGHLVAVVTGASRGIGRHVADAADAGEDGSHDGDDAAVAVADSDDGLDASMGVR